MNRVRVPSPGGGAAPKNNGVPVDFQPQLAPLGGLAISALVALLPLIAMFVTLGLLR